MKKGDVVLVSNDPAIGWIVRKFVEKSHDDFVVETYNGNHRSTWKYCVKLDKEVFNNQSVFPKRENGV